MIRYVDSVEGIAATHLNGFFEGWPNPPTPQTHLEILKNSDEVLLAVDDGSGNVVGFITAITDGALNAYIPLLEVLKPYRSQGIGTELTRRMLAKLGDLYAVHVLCDPELQPFYARFGMKPMSAMMIRRMEWQSGT